jgi:Kef-type K+ transport system membrane component KefB
VNSQQFNSVAHIIASIGSVIFLTCLPIFFYFVLLFAANETRGLSNLIVIPCLNLISAVLFTLIVFFPLSKLLDWLFQKVIQNRKRRIVLLFVSIVFLGLGWVLVFGGFALAMGVVLKNPFVLQVLDTQVDSIMVALIRVLFYGGLPVLLGGASYWFLLQASRKILSNRNNGKALREHPKAG